LDNNLVPNIEIMKKAIAIRKEPNKYKDDVAVMEWLQTLGSYVQQFADVLEKEIANGK
jgi:hypothetical protein